MKRAPTPFTAHPPILGKTLRSATNTYLSTEVFDGKRSICVVRATVIIERR